MKSQEICKTCKYCSRIPDLSGCNEEQGVCKRRSPVVQEDSGSAWWPVVELDSWCGEWEAKGKANDQSTEA